MNSENIYENPNYNPSTSFSIVTHSASNSSPQAPHIKNQETLLKTPRKASSESQEPMKSSHNQSTPGQKPKKKGK